MSLSLVSLSLVNQSQVGQSLVSQHYPAAGSGSWLGW